MWLHVLVVTRRSLQDRREALERLKENPVGVLRRLGGKRAGFGELAVVTAREPVQGPAGGLGNL